MRKLAFVVILLASTAVASAGQMPPTDLKLTARLAPSASGTPARIVISFLNGSNHAVSFPRPFFWYCGERAGMLAIRSTFTPSDPNSQQNKMGRGCSEPSLFAGHVRPDIIEQTKNWVVLGPNESFDFEDSLSRGMILGDAGKYLLFVVYTAPELEAQDLQKLRENNISLPAPGKYASNLVTFEIPQKLIAGGRP
jgi:hypothetical protein